MNKSCLIWIVVGLLAGYYLSIKIGGLVGAYLKPLGTV